VRDRGRRRAFRLDIDRRALARCGRLFVLSLPAALAVGLDPRRVEEARPRVPEESIEGGGDILEPLAIARRDDAVVPLDPCLQRGAREVRAADVGDAGGAGAIEDVGLGVEALVAALEDAQLNPAGEFLFEIEKPEERVRLGEVLVVAGDETQRAVFAAEKVTELLLDEADPLLEDEGDGDVGPGRQIERGAEVGQEGIVATGDEGEGATSWGFFRLLLPGPGGESRQSL